MSSSWTQLRVTKARDQWLPKVQTSPEPTMSLDTGAYDTAIHPYPGYIIGTRTSMLGMLAAFGSEAPMLDIIVHTRIRG